MKSKKLSSLSGVTVLQLAVTSVIFSSLGILATELYQADVEDQDDNVISNGISAGICEFDKIEIDPFIHKSVYSVGVHAVRGLEEAFTETNKVFAEFLSATAGQKFDPPITFEVTPYYFDGIFTAIESKEMDFLYANPGIYSCIGTQVGATALATVVKGLEVRGRTFALDVYGGVIATRRENDDINTIADLKDKIIGAGAIVDLMGGQMQIYEMEKAGMSYVNDPKQVVFTKDQIHVVRGILSGRFDAGFIRTDQIELTTDENGDVIDPDSFKIIQPKIYIMDSGEMFPFLHSTDIFPEWPLAALPDVPQDVQKAVQDALLAYDKYVIVGDLFSQCVTQNSSLFCSSLSPRDFFANAPCDTTFDLALLASEGSHASHIAGFRTARSYFELRSIQQEAGFMIQDERNNWHCTRPTNLFEGITCPEGYFKRRETEFLEGCEAAGLACDDNDEYDCFCQPCVKAFEVDVYHHIDGEQDPHLESFFGKSLPGCEKMSVCGIVEQGETLVLRIYDNMERDNVNVTVIDHSGDREKRLPVRNLDAPYAYEFSVYDKEVQVQVLEIFVNGVPISQSPIRVIVEEKNCDTAHGANSNRVPNAEGECVCASNTYEMAGTCLESSYFFLIIFSAVFIVLGAFISVYLGYKKKQSDSIWHVSVDELHFNEPPEVIGQGGFGVVILGQYRGTKVAVKRVLPPLKTTKVKTGILSSRDDADLPSADVIKVPSKTILSDKNKVKTKKVKGDKGQKVKNVKFGATHHSGDIESQSQSQSKNLDNRGSMSGSNTNWERLMMMHHSDNDILRILESATTSDHGSDDMLKNSSISTSRSHVLLHCLPMWLRFDEHSRRVNEFIIEMRMLSRLRHPCITTVMGAVVSARVDPMLGRLGEDEVLLSSCLF